MVSFTFSIIPKLGVSLLLLESLEMSLQNSTHAWSLCDLDITLGFLLLVLKTDCIVLNMLLYSSTLLVCFSISTETSLPFTAQVASVSNLLKIGLLKKKTNRESWKTEDQCIWPLGSSTLMEGVPWLWVGEWKTQLRNLLTPVLPGPMS